MTVFNSLFIRKTNELVTIKFIEKLAVSINGYGHLLYYHSLYCGKKLKVTQIKTNQANQLNESSSTRTEPKQQTIWMAHKIIKTPSVQILKNKKINQY